MPGRHDAPNEFTSLEDSKKAAEYVVSSGMAGVMLWSLNRDTNHRTGASGTVFETGMEDGSYIKCISEVFSKC
jgi:GH18 family chitinase